LVPDPQVVSRRLEDQLVLVHLGTSRVYALNRTAARFWAHLISGGDLDEITRRMTDEFDVEAEALAREIERLVGSLRTEQLVHEELAGRTR